MFYPEEKIRGCGSALRRCLILMCCGLALILSGTANAADWYVDNAAGGANTGQSWGDAWRSFADVVWGESGVKAGDTLFISGGSSSKNYTGTLNVSAGGRADAPITIRPGQDPGHSGTVVFNGNPSGCITVYDRSFITIDGSTNGTMQFVFQNGLMDAWNALVDASGVNRFTVRYCEFRTATIGLNAQYCTASEFDHNYFHDIRGEAALRLDGSAGEGPEGPGWWDSNRIHDNFFVSDAAEDGSGEAVDQIQGSSALSIFNNTIEYRPGPNHGWQHPDACQVSGRYNKIYGNRIVNAPNAAVSMDLGGEREGHIHMFNNIIECTVPAWTGYMKAWDLNIVNSGTAVDDVLFANNTVAGINNTHTIAVHLREPGIRLTNWKIVNNVFYQCGEMNGGTVILFDEGDYAVGSDVTIDFNLIHNGERGGNLISVKGGQFYDQPNPRTEAPSFAAYAYRGGANDYHVPGDDTALRGRGVALTPYFTADKDGTPRNGWTLGAYE